MQGHRQVFETGGAKVSVHEACGEFLATCTSGHSRLMHVHLYICAWRMSLRRWLITLPTSDQPQQAKLFTFEKF